MICFVASQNRSAARSSDRREISRPQTKRFYGIRDVTATVESVPLITASILSKKLAAGLGGLVLDVKCGNGAFMDQLDKARELSRSLVEVASGAGLPTTALLTDMNQPLASAAGNAVEITNCIDFLTGRHVDTRLFDVTVALGAELLLAAGLANTEGEAMGKMEQSISSGAAAEIFAKMIAGLGGPANLLERPEVHLPKAEIVRPVYASGSGSVVSIDTRGIGIAVVALGGGRVRAADSVDLAVGFTELAMVGDPIDANQPLGFGHARSEDQFAAAARSLQIAYSLGDARNVEDAPVIIEKVTV